MVGVLKEYDTVSTDHFVIRVDRSRPGPGGTGGGAARSGLSGTRPAVRLRAPARTQFEIYARARGQSARLVQRSDDRPAMWIQTVGASTGRVVALASPLDSPRPFNWAVVLKHELVHVITLQATEFRIPHWLTEALAVKSEGGPDAGRLASVLTERYPGPALPARHDQRRFSKPRQRQDWDLAYCQSRLYPRVPGEDLRSRRRARMLAAYRQGKSTGEVLRETLQTSPSRFESEFIRFVKGDDRHRRGQPRDPAIRSSPPRRPRWRWHRMNPQRRGVCVRASSIRKPRTG